MASPNIYSAGLNLAGTVFQNGPATLRLSGSTYLSGAVQWVDTIGGNNANSGAVPQLPVKTLAQAITNSAANGVIVVGEGSSESPTTSQSINLAGLTIFGCGSGSSRPRYRATFNADPYDMWSVGAAGVWIEGFYFPASTGAMTSRVSLAGADGVVKDCYFECGSGDVTQSLYINGNSCRVLGTSFVATASRPDIGLMIAGPDTDTTVEDTTFDGGSYGWATYAMRANAAALRTRFRNVTFSNHSDLGFTATGTSYQLFGVQMDGTSRVVITA